MPAMVSVHPDSSATRELRRQEVRSKRTRPRPGFATTRLQEVHVPYHGNVRVGGPADLRDLADLQITKIAVGPMENNAYLLRSPQTGETLLIDAAAEAPRLLGWRGRDRPRRHNPLS